MTTKAYRAYSKHGAITRDTPREAAASFFEKYPTARKCNVTEGAVDGLFFTVTYGRASLGQWPQRWIDVTKKTLASLPGAVGVAS